MFFFNIFVIISKTTVVELQRLYVGSGTGAIFEELRGTAASVFNTCTDLVFQFGSEGTYQEQLQAASLIVIKVIDSIRIKLTTTSVFRR